MWTSLLMLAVVADFFWRWRREARRADTAEAALAEERKKASASRIFAEEPQALLARIGQTGIGADQLLNPYLEKWITLSGRFEGTAESLLGDAIHLSLMSERGRLINIRFSIESRDRLQSLSSGQRLTAQCQVKHGYGLGVFELHNGELVRVEPLKNILALAS